MTQGGFIFLNWSHPRKNVQGLYREGDESHHTPERAVMGAFYTFVPEMWWIAPKLVQYQLKTDWYHYVPQTYKGPKVHQFNLMWL